MASKGVAVGQVFASDDGGITVTVIRVGSAQEKARFRIESLKTEKASYTVIVKRKTGASPDRIKWETDNPNNIPDHELSHDETTGVEIVRNP